MAEMQRDELGPLPAGRHAYTREQVAHDQYERMIAAVAEAVAERGYAAVTVGDIAKIARVSRRTFYEQFESKEDCFLAAFDAVAEHMHRLVDEAGADAPDWPHRVAAGIGALLDFFVEEPALAKLCMVDALSAGPRVADRYREVVIGFVPLLRPGRELHKGMTELPQSTEDTIIGSLASVLARRIVAGEAAELASLKGDFISFVLAPYLGNKRARKISAEAA